MQKVEKQWIDLKKKETYHTPESFESAGMAPFVEHTTQYLAGERTVPVCKAPSIAGEYMYFTFSDSLHQLLIDDLQKMKKPYEAALKYGFQGYSKGGKNGVFLLRKQDGGLLSDIERLVNKQGLVIMEDLCCCTEDLPRLRRVKIVCHEPGGTRVLGAMNEATGRAVFLGFGQY